MAEQDVVASGVVAGSADNHAPAADDNPQGTVEWAKGLDEGLRKKVDKFKTPADLAKSYAELEAYTSKSFQDMTDSEREKYIKRLGLPEKPEEYELSNITLPEGIERSKTADDDFKAFVHQAKLTKAQAKMLHEWSMKRYSDAVLAQRAAEKGQAEEREKALRTSWGQAHDANNATVEKLIKLGGDEFVQYMNNGPGKDSIVRKGLLALSQYFADETLVNGRVERPKSGTIPSGFVFDPGKSPELVGTKA